MRILAMDTATNACSVALMQDGKLIERRFEPMSRGQAEALVPMIDDVLTTASVGADDLDLVAVTIGPGAFTGLRIGLAAARGFALAANIPCIGLTTTETLAHGAPVLAEGCLLVALDSKRSDLYVQVFSPALEALKQPQALEPGHLAGYLEDVAEPVTLIGDAVEQAQAALKGTPLTVVPLDEPRVPDAAILAKLAQERYTPSQNLAPPAPLYLRPPDAKRPKHGGRLRP